MEEENNWQRYCFRPAGAIGGNSVRLLKNGEEAFGEMIGAVKAAREYVLLEFYAFSDDAAGRFFSALLKEKLRQGVAVYLIRDAVGSILTDRDFFSSLAAAGAGVAEYRPVVLWKPYWNCIKRDHRKILCVDGSAAFVGGFNITESYLPPSLGGRGWKDAQARVEGPAVAEIEKLFWQSWCYSRIEGACPGGTTGIGKGIGKVIATSYSTLTSTSTFPTPLSAVSIALASVGPVTVCAVKTSAFLAGKRLTGEVIAKAAEIVKTEVAPITDTRSEADYRREMCGVLVSRALQKVVKGQSGKGTKAQSGKGAKL